MEKINKQCYTVNLCSISVLMIMSFIRYGVNKVSIIAVFTLLLSLATISGVYFFVKSDMVKGTLILVLGGAACITYSVLVGGSTTAIFAFFSVLALAAIYLSTKIIIFTMVPNCIYLIIVSIINPVYVEGPDNATVVGAISKTVIVVGSSVIIAIATKRGEGMIEETKNVLRKVQKQSDITSEVATKLNDAVDKGNGLVQGVVNQADGVLDTSQQINVAMDTMMHSLNNINDNVSSAADSITQNKELSDRLDISFKKVADTVDIGNTGAESVKGALSNMFGEVQLALQVTMDLTEQMNNIGKILDQINGIAKQTNMLSLNASIEASRAGEHGRGFAVVAEEIRLLSEDSTRASSNISSILSQLKVAADNVAVKINSGVDAANTGMAEMDQLLGLLSNITDITQEAGAVVSKEHTLISNITTDIEKINEEMDNLVVVGEENLAMIKDVTDSIEVQNCSVKNLKEHMSSVSELSTELESC